ncbi:MAG: ferritin-like domain-containing protein [Myxococcota bacterium]
MTNLEPQYSFEGARFDLHDDGDRAIVCFFLSQALYGEATGVYCGKSLYTAGSLEAARFYLRQARQELNHLELFADIFRKLDMQPVPAHWAIKLLASHNNYYPLKVLMEHAVGEGMVLDIFRDVILQTLPDDDERVPDVKKRLAVVCREEEEHVAWGEKETIRLLAEKPWLRTPYYGLVELQLLVAPLVTKAFERRFSGHPVLAHVPGFVEHVRQRVLHQGRRLGFVPETRPGLFTRLWAMTCGGLLYFRSQFSGSHSVLDKRYLEELGFTAG